MNLKFYNFFCFQYQKVSARTNLASRVAWLSLCLSLLGAFFSILIATFWLSNLEMTAKHDQLATDIEKFSAINVSSLSQYDFARLEDLGEVFAQENKLIKDLEIWHFEGLRMMQYGDSIPANNIKDGQKNIRVHNVLSADQQLVLGTLRYRLVDLSGVGLSSTYWIATALMIIISCMMTALMMQRLLKNYLVKPLTELTIHVQNFSLNEPQIEPFVGGARELRQLYTSFKNMENRVVNQATTDPVTGLRNRIYLESCIKQAQACDQHSCAVLLLDLDHFKRINDNYGHPTGDLLLNSIAKKLSELLEPGTELIRMGGDEFAIWFHCDSASDVAEIIELKILGAMQQPFSLENGRYTTVRLSGGFAHYPLDVCSPKNLLKAADLALYKTKEMRTGNVTYYTQNLSVESNEWLEIADLLHIQLADNSLLFYFQKIVHASSQMLWGYEMLLRLIAPSGKIYNTETVMQVAGQLGLNESIVERTIDFAVDALNNKIRCASLTINMSPEQMVLLTPLKISLLFASIPLSLRQRIIIELTEQSLLDKRDVLTPITQLHTLGYKIALDDFGSGYSAMSCLSSFPLSIVKIDKSLTQDLLQLKNRKLLSSITYISKNMGFTVIAEGIESNAQYQEISSLGCDLVQGYLFGKPSNLDYDRLIDN